MRISTCLYCGIAVLFLHAPPPSSAQNGNLFEVYKHLRSARSAPLNSTAFADYIKQIIYNKGVTFPFCDYFGCAINAKSECDDGYKWDESFNRCRKLVW